MELKIDEAAVRQKYNAVTEIWPEDDKWHMHTHGRIANFIHAFAATHSITNNTVILNAGSGGVSYGLPDGNMIHMDVADEKVSHFPKHIVGSVEDIPMPAASVDVCMCVGSVLDYCDAVKVIAEFCRVLRPGGSMVLEYENSMSLDMTGTAEYGQDAVLIATFYNHQQEILRVYAQSYIDRLLAQHGFTVQRRDYIHIMAPLVYKYTHNADLAARFAFLDGLLQYIPSVRRHSSNIIMSCVKQ